MEQEPQSPKFGMVEIILGGLFSAFLDLVSALLDFFADAGAIVQNLAWLLFAFWFMIKGCRVTASLAKRYLIPLAVQLIPFLPTLTATFLVTAYMENHPEKFAAVEKVASVASGKSATSLAK